LPFGILSDNSGIFNQNHIFDGSIEDKKEKARDCFFLKKNNPGPACF